jgi:hypothetical protein
MELTDITIGKAAYKIGRLSTFTQLHVLRRLGPSLLSLLPLFTGGKEPEPDAPAEEIATAEQETAKKLIRSLPQLAEALYEMKDEDAEYVINRCLEVAWVVQPTGPARIRTNGVTMIQDLDLPTTLQLTFNVLTENLGGFFPTELPKV